MSLRNDPIQWTRSAVGNRLGFAVMICFHAAAVFGILVLPQSSGTRILAALAAFYGILYLFAMRALLGRISPTEDATRSD